MTLPKYPVPKVQHKDGSLWEASCQTDEDENYNWAIGLFDSGKLFFFRKLELNPKRKWYTFWRPKYIRTGETWEGGELMDWIILPAAFNSIEWW